MNKSRIEAFSDGVLAIIITIMVLELKVPNGSSFASRRPMAPVFLSYVLSFERLYRYGVFGGFVPKEREALSRIGWKLGDPLPPVRLAREGYIQRRLW